MSDSVQPHRRQPTRHCHPWDSPGKNTGVGCHALLQGIFLTQGLNPCLLMSPALAGGLFTTSATREADQGCVIFLENNKQTYSHSVGRPYLCFFRVSYTKSLEKTAWKKAVNVSAHKMFRNTTGSCKIVS